MMAPVAAGGCAPITVLPATQDVIIVDVPLPLSESSAAAYEHDSGSAAEVQLPPAVSEAIRGMGLQRSAGVVQLVQQQVPLQL